jgi:hypothetical protein
MGKRLRALAILRFPDQVYAQIAEAHHYDNAPIGVTQLELAYAYCVAETLPAKREQLAGTECIRHVKFQENAVSQLQL